MIWSFSPSTYLDLPAWTNNIQLSKLTFKLTKSPCDTHVCIWSYLLKEFLYIITVIIYMKLTILVFRRIEKCHPSILLIFLSLLKIIIVLYLLCTFQFLQSCTTLQTFELFSYKLTLDLFEITELILDSILLQPMVYCLQKLTLFFMFSYLTFFM